MPKPLHNRLSKEDCLRRLAEEAVPRKTVSFYRYVTIEDPKAMRDTLFREWSALGCLGRIYLAEEGINAQMNVPEAHWDTFVEKLYQHKVFADVPFKIAVEEGEPSFWKLTIKVKDKIVADGIDDPDFNPSDTGDYLTAEAFHQALDEGAIAVDMRNHYESEVGHFEGAYCPDVDTFREQLPRVKEELKGKEDQKVVMYCTGGIRCEKASAYLKHHGFKDVHHLKGGIIDYAHQIQRKNLPSRFVGKNFVFDGRVGERITDDVIASCHQCGASCDRHVNCHNDACHLLFLQCEDCEAKHDGQYCSQKCHDFDHLPEDEKKEKRKGAERGDCLAVYKGRLRPKLGS